MRPHNEHWSTPVLAYRAAFQVFGLDSYRPFQLMIVLCRGSGHPAGDHAPPGPVDRHDPAVVLLFFGPGSQNIVWAFQIGFVGSVFRPGAAGAHRPRRRLDRRDRLGLVFASPR
jgi:hypothetical protein